jgi:ribosomal protein L31
MAKKDIHPKINNVSFQFSGGKTMIIPSASNKLNVLTEQDIFNHSAWREDDKAVHSGSVKVAKFAQTFGGASFGGSFSGVNLNASETEEVKAETKKAPKKAKSE